MTPQPTTARPISRAEQAEMDLLPVHSRNYVPAAIEAKPRTVQGVIDPYAPYMPQPVEQVVQVHVTPVTRAQAMVMKVHQVTLFLGLLTGAALLMFGTGTFFLWLLLASAEWVAVFVVLSIYDYRETPAAQNRMQMTGYLRMMEREQLARLRHLYPNQEID